jgi:hypothetical protein
MVGCMHIPHLNTVWKSPNHLFCATAWPPAYSEVRLKSNRQLCETKAAIVYSKA